MSAPAAKSDDQVVIDLTLGAAELQRRLDAVAEVCDVDERNPQGGWHLRRRIRRAIETGEATG